MKQLLQELLEEINDAVYRDDIAMASKLTEEAIKIAELMNEDGEML